MRMSLAVLAALASVAIGLTACGSTGSSAGNASPRAGSSAAVSSTPAARSSTRATVSSTASQPATSAMITIKNFAYRVSGPVSAGEKVTVTNNDDVSHTVTADSGSLFSVNVTPGHMASFTAPGKAGTYKFHCNYHANMHGKLVVK